MVVDKDRAPRWQPARIEDVENPLTSPPCSARLVARPNEAETEEATQ